MGEQNTTSQPAKTIFATFLIKPNTLPDETLPINILFWCNSICANRRINWLHRIWGELHNDAMNCWIFVQFIHSFENLKIEVLNYNHDQYGLINACQCHCVGFLGKKQSTHGASSIQRYQIIDVIFWPNNQTYWEIYHSRVSCSCYDLTSHPGKVRTTTSLYHAM